MAARPVKVLIVDDSAVFRRMLSLALAQNAELEVIGCVGGAAEARTFLAMRRPDVIALDVEMPVEDGLTFLKRQMREDPIATVIISGLTGRSVRFTIEALEAGAVDVVPKPSVERADLHSAIPAFANIAECLQGAAAARLRRSSGQWNRSAVRETATRSAPTAPQAPAMRFAPDWVVGIGSSTGGVQALTAVLPEFPADAPPVVVVQHMPAGFTSAFARRLDSLCKMHVREAAHGDILEPGTVFLAPGGDRHLVLDDRRGTLRVQLIEGEPVAYSRPSVDVMMTSLSYTTRHRVAACILTGMGRDGAEGLHAIRKMGGRTFAQDEATSQIYGMPARAWDLGAAEEQVPLGDMARRLLDVMQEPARPGASQVMPQK